MVCVSALGATRPAAAQAPSPPVLLAPGETPPPTTSGWPDANSTGLYRADGTTLRGQCASLCSSGVTTSGNINTSSSGQTIQCRKITGQVNINHDNVTLRCFEIQDNSDITAIWVNGRAGTVIEDGKVDMGPNPVDGSEAIHVKGGATNTRMSRLEILRMDDGIKVDTADTFTAESNWLHDFQPPPDQPNHPDGFELDGGASNGTITGNNVENQYGGTSAVMVDNWQGSNRNIKIDGNRLTGGSFTVYCDGSFNSNALTGISYTNNRMGAGQYGYSLIRNCSSTFTGNIDDSTGKAIP
jgi:hypothetical protein